MRKGGHFERTLLLPKTRNQPSVSTCDNCHTERRPTVSWTDAANTDGLGWEVRSTMHFCEACLRASADRLAEHQPFMEVMRWELLEKAGVEVPPKARYDEVRALYQEHGLEQHAPAPISVEIAALVARDPSLPTIPEVRRSAKSVLEGMVTRHSLPVEIEGLTRDELISAIVGYLESAPVSA